jgi:protein-tyrosine phosphatase
MREDFFRFDLIVAMDAANLRHLTQMRPDGARAELSLLLDHVPGRAGEPVADPYHGDSDHFERTWAEVRAGAAALAARLAAG